MKKTTEKLGKTASKFIRSPEIFLREKYHQLSKISSAVSEMENKKELPKKVLIIDDSIVIREMVGMTLKQAGYQVEKAWDGQHAWEILQENSNYDLIFCDIQMPRMNGLELLNRLKKDSSLSNIPVAMLTSCDSEDIIKIVEQLGARAYQQKPYQVQDLLATAELVIKGKNLLAEGNLSLAQTEQYPIASSLGFSVQTI